MDLQQQQLDEAQVNFQNILQAQQAAQAQPPAPQPGLASVIQPQPAGANIEQPTQDPNEIQSRMEKWKTVMSDPNFMRAVGVVGAHLSQPRQYGQTKMGQFGQAFTAGTTAYDMSRSNDIELARQAQKDAQSKAESEANVEGTKARTATSVAELLGVKADTGVKVATAGDKVAQAKTHREKAEFDLSKAKSEEAVDKITREVIKKKAEIERDIPDQARRDAAMSELEALALKVKEAKARILASNASAGASTAASRASNIKADAEQITVDVIKKMPPDEQKQFLTKTGKFSQHTSGIGQQATMWGDIYDKLPATDAHKTGKTKEQFQMDRLTEAKGQDALKLLTDYVKNTTDPDPDIIQMYTDLAKSGAKAKGAPEPAAKADPKASGGGTVKLVRDANGKLVIQ